MSAARVTWGGHSTVLVELAGARLLTDPVLRSHVAHLRRHGEPPAADLAERLDAVLVSHLHYDHLDLPSLRGISGRGHGLRAARGGRAAPASRLRRRDRAASRRVG